MSDTREQIILSVDQINNVEVCPTLYHYKSILGKQPAIKASFLEAGDLMHKIFQLYYTDLMHGKTPDLKIIYEQARNFAATSIVGLKSDEIETVIEDAQMYFNFYGLDSGWVIEAVEEPFAKLLYEDDSLRIAVVGRIDLRVFNKRINQRLLIDHKYEAEFRKKFERDNQPLCYAWGYEVKDFVYNRIGKQKSYEPKKRLQRPILHFTNHQIEQWKESAIDAAREILSFYKNDHWPMRFTGCHFGNNKCAYYDVCNTTESNREYKLRTMFVDRVSKDIMEKGK